MEAHIFAIVLASPPLSLFLSFLTCGELATSRQWPPNYGWLINSCCAPRSLGQLDSSTARVSIFLCHAAFAADQHSTLLFVGATSSPSFRMGALCDWPRVIITSQRDDFH